MFLYEEVSRKGGLNAVPESRLRPMHRRIDPGVELHIYPPPLKEEVLEFSSAVVTSPFSFLCT